MWVRDGVVREKSVSVFPVVRTAQIAAFCKEIGDGVQLALPTTIAEAKVVRPRNVLPTNAVSAGQIKIAPKTNTAMKSAVASNVCSTSTAPPITNPYVLLTSVRSAKWAPADLANPQTPKPAAMAPNCAKKTIFGEPVRTTKRAHQENAATKVCVWSNVHRLARSAKRNAPPTSTKHPELTSLVVKMPVVAMYGTTANSHLAKTTNPALKACASLLTALLAKLFVMPSICVSTRPPIPITAVDVENLVSPAKFAPMERVRCRVRQGKRSAVAFVPTSREIRNIVASVGWFVLLARSVQQVAAWFRVKPDWRSATINVSISPQTRRIVANAVWSALPSKYAPKGPVF